MMIWAKKKSPHFREKYLVLSYLKRFRGKKPKRPLLHWCSWAHNTRDKSSFAYFTVVFLLCGSSLWFLIVMGLHRVHESHSRTNPCRHVKQVDCRYTTENCVDRHLSSAVSQIDITPSLTRAHKQMDRQNTGTYSLVQWHWLSVTSLDAPEIHASSDVRERILLHQAVHDKLNILLFLNSWCITVTKRQFYKLHV